MPAQLPRRITPLQLATGQQIEEHGWLALGQAQNKVAGGSNLIELLPVHRAPGLQVEVRVSGHCIAQELLVASDQWLEGGGQIGRQRQAHGLSLIGVK